MTVYAESSAILAWALGQPGFEEVRGALRGARRVVASSLTRLECARALARRDPGGTETLAALQLLDQSSREWTVMDMSEPVLLRAARRFPREPVRTLDAIHLASALEFNADIGPVTVLSLDDRIRENAAMLGMQVLPN